MHSPSPSEFKTSDEIPEPKEKFESMECNFVPLGYNSFQILKETLEQMLKDKHIESQEISFEPMQQSCQSFQDPITEQLDDLCCQNNFSFASHELKRSYDLDMVRQSFLCFDSALVFSQNSLEKPRINQHVQNDIDGICALSDHGVEMDKFEYQEISHVYHDPIVVYMEELLFSEYPLIPKASGIVHGPKTLCYED